MNRFVIADAKECIGCRVCEVACVMTHNGGKHPEVPELYLPRIKVIKTAAVKTAVTCRHCEDAPCAQVCPSGALVQANDSIQLNKDKCIGCKTCVLACPFGAIGMVEESVTLTSSDSGLRTTAHKCDLCIDDAKSPACVTACPAKALRVVSGETMLEQQKQKLKLAAMREDPTGAKRTVAVAPRPLLDRLSGQVTVPRGDAHKIALAARKTEFVEIYKRFTPEQVNGAIAAFPAVITLSANGRVRFTIESLTGLLWLSRGELLKPLSFLTKPAVCRKFAVAYAHRIACVKAAVR